MDRIHLLWTQRADKSGLFIVWQRYVMPLQNNLRIKVSKLTFIDHNSRTVLNGSALGKEFSANALGSRFADFAMEENQQPILSIPQKEALGPLQEDKQPITVKGYSGDDSSVGNLFSVLIPEPDQHDTNEPIPKKRKKKKRRYGRQL